MEAILSQFTDRALWDLLDEVSFWIKDGEGRFIWVNQTLVEQANKPREMILGCLDSDLFLNELAAAYMSDDKDMMVSGVPIVNKAELVVSREGAVAWYSTSKFPLFDEAGGIVGTYGMSRPMAGDGDLPEAYVDLSRIVKYVRENVGVNLSVEALSAFAGMSFSTLQRTVRRHLKMTPQELIFRVRMQHARHLLTMTTMKVGEVALACGYESFSSFSRAFKEIYGFSPGKVKQGVGLSF